MADAKILIANLVEGLKKEYKGGLVNWASIDANGVRHHNTNTACHAGMSYPGNIGKQEYIASRDMSVANEHYKHRPLPLDVKVEYLKWLTYKSPYAKFFCKKGGKALHNLGMVVCKVDAGPANILAGALIAHRYIWEYPTVPFIWHKLVQCGVDPAIAFYHAHQVQTNDFENIASIHFNLAGHNCLSGAAFSKESVLNFKNNTPKNVTGIWSKDGRYGYTPIANAWGGGVKLGSYLTGRLGPIYEQAKALAKREKKVNPFPKAGQRVDLREIVPVSEFCQLWAEVLNKEYAIA